MQGLLPGITVKLVQLLNVLHVIPDMEFLLMVASNASQASTAQDLHVQNALQANFRPPPTHHPVQHAHLEAFHLRDHLNAPNVRPAHTRLVALVFNVQQAPMQHLEGLQVVLLVLVAKHQLLAHHHVLLPLLLVP